MLEDSYYTDLDLRLWGKLRQLGVGVRVSKNAVIVEPERIEFGDRVRVDAMTLLVAAGGYLKVGKDCHIASSVTVGAGAGVEIGDRAAISHGARIFSRSDDFGTKGLLQAAPVLIGSDAIVGANSVLLPGAIVPEGCAIGALSLVRAGDRLESWAVYAGVQLRKIRNREIGTTLGRHFPNSSERQF